MLFINVESLDFYPRSPYGERPRDGEDTNDNGNNFYPRSPYGERPMAEGSICFDSSISIHALLTESDGFGSAVLILIL